MHLKQPSNLHRMPYVGKGLKTRIYGDGFGNILKSMVKGAKNLFKQAAPKLKKAGIELLKKTGSQLKQAGEKYIEDNKDELKDEIKKLGKKAVKIAKEEAEEGLQDLLEGKNVKKTIETRGKSALTRTARSAGSRGKRVSKAQFAKIQDIMNQQALISKDLAKEAAEDVQTELSKDLSKARAKLGKEIKNDIDNLNLNKIFKIKGSGLKQLGRGSKAAKADLW